MHRFAIYPPDNQDAPCNLVGAHLLGADGVPARGEIRFEDGQVVCESRNTEPLGLSLLWHVDGFGCVQLETTRLPPREQPYHLHVELVRHRLMRISQKCEEWGLFDYPGMEEVTQVVDGARARFIEALKHTDEPVAAARLADEALTEACRAADLMCTFHAGVFLSRRRQSGGFGRNFLGVSLAGADPKPRIDRGLAEAFDFARVPLVWQNIQPKEQGSDYTAADATVRAALKAGLAIHCGPLLNFGVQFVPPWLVIWENDYEAIADFAREHIKRTVKRYAGKVHAWIAASGLHTDSVFSLNFEQIMDLTRVAATATKQTDPRAQVVLDVTQPWGEYYARNQQTIPPLLYAEMAVQSGVPFDAFGLQFIFGIDSDGFHLRDLIQISALIDRLANLGKPLHITAVGAPAAASSRGSWKSPWSEETQAEWLASFCEIALSKPYVESVCLHALTDAGAGGVPGGGVLHDDLSPKTAVSRLARVRREIKRGA